MLSTAPPRRRGAALATALAVALGSFLFTSSPASAAAGPAPTPAKRQILQKVHTDAVSTFIDDGKLTLGSKADLEENGTRLDPAGIVFHVGNESKKKVNAGYEFLAPAGSEVWIAPESNPSDADGYTQLWPGFSTESPPAGVPDNNRTTFTLVDVKAPTGGDVELWTGSGLDLTHRWSSDGETKSFTVGRTHMHANWGFTRPGTYELTVKASGTISQAPVSATATYTFVVGDLPATTTSTALTVAKADLTAGEKASLSASVTPSDADGYVEFLDGESVLGHEKPVDGKASFSADLAVGQHALTARFVPADATFITGSTSTAVAVTVVDESGLPFAVLGIADSYRVGDTISARLSGYIPAEGQEVYWYRTTDTATSGTAIQTNGNTTLTSTADALWSDTYLRVRLVDSANKSTYTPWVPVKVASGLKPITLAATGGDADNLYPGDTATFTASGYELAEGEAVVYGAVLNGAWREFTDYPTYLLAKADGPQLTVTGGPSAFNYTWRIVAAIKRGSALVGISPIIPLSTKAREVQIEGTSDLYRAGSTISLDATVYPVPSGDLAYTWEYTLDGQTTVWGTAEQSVSAVTSPTLTMAHNGGSLILKVFRASDGVAIGQSASSKVNITEEQGQIFSLSNFSGHYHQNSPVTLKLTVSPAVDAKDTIAWEWKWPGTGEWTTIPGVTGTSGKLTAEQGLSGVQVRARLVFADQGKENLVSEVRTIEVDDHGAAPSQKVSISSLKDHYHSGSAIALTGTVEPASMVTGWAWFVQKAGAESPVKAEGQNTSKFELTAAKDLDGATITARLVLPNGETYVASEPVTIKVNDHEEPEPVTPVITIDGLKDHYHTGSELTLNAKQTPDSGEDHWHWFIKTTGANDYTVIPGQLTANLTKTIDKADNGAQIIAKLYDHDHTVIAESEPVTIKVNDHEEPEPTPSVEPSSSATPPVDPSPSAKPSEPTGSASATPAATRKPSAPAASGTAGKKGSHPGLPSTGGDDFGPAGWVIGLVLGSVTLAAVRMRRR